jgi:hypothetical protein
MPKELGAMRLSTILRGAVLALPLAAVADTAAAGTGIVLPPANSRSFIQLYEIDSGRSVCDILCALEASPDPSVDLAGFSGTGSGGLTFINGSGSIDPTAIHAFVASNVGAEIDAAFADTYTVHGGTAPFDITANLAISGTAATGGLGRFAHIIGGVTGVIGTLDTGAQSGFPQVVPFDGSTKVLHQISLIGAPQSEDFNVLVSYTRTVSPGEVFDLAYEFAAALDRGSIDASHTATIGFDLPDGVFLTSAGGATFGDAPVAGGVPEPASWTLMILGFGVAGAAARRRPRIRRALSQ